MAKSPAWSAEEKRLVWRMYGTAGNEKIAKTIREQTGRERTPNAIQIIANRLGATKQIDGCLTLIDVARHLGVTYALLHSMAKAGKVANTKRGKCRWVDFDEIERLDLLFQAPPARSMTKTNAMKRLGYCESHMTRLLQAGVIRGTRRGERWFVDEDHIDELVAAMKKTGDTRMDLMSHRGLDAERAKASEYARTKRKQARQEARREVWYTQMAAARALGVGRDDMRRMLQAGEVRGRRENYLWLAERAHVDELAARRATA